MSSLDVTEVDIYTSIPIYCVWKVKPVVYACVIPSRTNLLLFFIIYLDLWKNHSIIILENY